MIYTITSGVDDVEESRHVFQSDISARQFVRSDFDFLTSEELDTLFTEGEVRWNPIFDEIDWIRLQVS